MTIVNSATIPSGSGNANINTSANSNANTGSVIPPNNASNGSRVPMFAVFIGIALGLIIITCIHAVGTFEGGPIISVIVFGVAATAIALVLIARNVKQCCSNGHGNNSNGSTNSTRSCCREFGCFCLSLFILLAGIGIGIGILFGVDDLLHKFLGDDGYFNDSYIAIVASVSIFSAVAVLMAIVFIIRAVKRCKTNASTNSSHSAYYSNDLSMFLVGTASGLAIIFSICAVDRSISLHIFSGVAVLVVIVWCIATDIKNRRAGTTNNNPSTSTNDEKYPSDSYSFLAIYGPICDTDLFSFGLMVFLIQATLLILMILSVVEESMRTSGAVDNPDSDYDWLAGFIPANVSSLVRTTQIVSILSYMIFAEHSLLDVIKAVDIFPRFDKATVDDKAGRVACSCILRFLQGILATSAVFLLVMTSSEVIEIILNFTAVNFISKLDETAFKLAKSGKFGPVMKEATEKIEQKPLPSCSYRKHKHVRYSFVVIPIALVLLGMLYYIGFSQENNNKWITTTLKVQFEETFDETTSLQKYNGCYEIDEKVGSYKRHKYIFLNDYTDRTQFGYCKEKRRWVLFKSYQDNIDPCGAGEDELAHSSKTDSFDISTSFGETWYSAYNTPLDLFFFELGDKDKKENCLSSGNGICNDLVNTFEFKYDEGDCCAATCTNPNCGIEALEKAFDTEILPIPGNGFPSCKDPSMVPVIIRLDQILISKNDTSSNAKLKLDCDGRNVFLINVNQSMVMKNETVMVRDEVKCTLKIEEFNNYRQQSWEVYYSVFYGYSQYDKQFEIYRGKSNSTENNDEYFSVDGIFSKNSITSKIGLLTNLMRLDLDSNSLTGTLPSEIGLLSNLNTINLNNNSLTGTLPSEIGLLSNLNTIDLGDNSLTGTLPSEIGLLSKLNTIDFRGILNYDSLTGTLPSEIGLLSNLTHIDLWDNSLTGTFPSEIGLLSNLNYIDLYSNSLTGTLPSEIGLLSNLNYITLNYNSLTGTLPSEIGLLSKLNTIILHSNSLTGTLPSEIGLLSNLNTIVLGDNSLTGTLPSEIGLLSILNYIDLGSNYLTGSLPCEVQALLAFNQSSWGWQGEEVRGSYLPNSYPCSDIVT